MRVWKGHLHSDSSVSGKGLPGRLHSRCHKSESEPGWKSEGSHSPAGARGLALGKDFPGAALVPPFLLLILLGEGEGQEGVLRLAEAVGTASHGPAGTDSRCRTGEHRITPQRSFLPASLPTLLPLVLGVYGPSSLGGNAWQEHLATACPPCPHVPAPSAWLTHPYPRIDVGYPSPGSRSLG